MVYNFKNRLFVGILISAVAGTALTSLKADAQDVTLVAEASSETETISLDSERSKPVSKVRVIKEPVPISGKQDFVRKAATETPSGFPVPRYVSLKFGTVNGRTGPSRDHSIAWQYRRRGMPLIIVAETELWRKVRDVNGDEAWVRKPALSGERFVVTIGESALLAKPKLGSKVVAETDGGALMRLETCNEDGWCQVKAGNGLRGWTSNRHLWGAESL